MIVRSAPPAPAAPGRGLTAAESVAVPLQPRGIPATSRLRRLTNSDCFDFVTRHKGMFSRLGATPEQVERLRAEHGIYMVGDSRINVAGLNARTVPVLAKAMVIARYVEEKDERRSENP